MRAIHAFAGAHPRRCGADIGFSHASKLCGLIPAGAGQMPGNSRSYRAVTAHPRRCGADIFPASRLAITWGSSPQVRGRLEHSKRRPLGGRLIPAGAGQISTTTLTPVMDSAHPRRCGADWRYPPSFSALHGSSPQVRGRLYNPRDRNGSGGSSPQVRGRCTRELHDQVAVRLIPAGAGQIPRGPRQLPPR